MPFKSRSQLRFCFSQEEKQKKLNSFTEACREWLKETPDPYCLPERKGGKVTCKPKKGPLVGPIKEGPRKGRYRMVAGTKVYL